VCVPACLPACLLIGSVCCSQRVHHPNFDPFPSRAQEAPAYGKLRIERTNARLMGARLKKVKEAEKEKAQAQGA